MSDAQRWRELAEEALAAATGMTDPAMSTIMWQIAAGYRLLAQHAERRDAVKPLRPSPASVTDPRR